MEVAGRRRWMGRLERGLRLEQESWQTYFLQSFQFGKFLVSGFSILDSRWASYQVLERGSWQEWEGEEKSGSAFWCQPPSNVTIWGQELVIWKIGRKTGRKPKTRGLPKKLAPFKAGPLLFCESSQNRPKKNTLLMPSYKCFQLIASWCFHTSFFCNIAALWVATCWSWEVFCNMVGSMATW